MDEKVTNTKAILLQDGKGRSANIIYENKIFVRVDFSLNSNRYDLNDWMFLREVTSRILAEEQLGGNEI